MESEDYEELQEYRRENTRKKKKKEYRRRLFTNLVKKITIKRFIIGIVAILAVGILVFGAKSVLFTESDTVSLGFKDIGELATESCTATEVNNIQNPVKVFGQGIPFTTRKFIFSYEVNIKAGYDFKKITYDVNEKTKVINVKLPKVKVLSAEIDQNSFKQYLNESNIFNPFTPKENNETMKKLKEKALKEAIGNGLYDKAYENAKTLLKGFIGQDYDLKDEYTIKFTREK